MEAGATLAAAPCSQQRAHGSSSMYGKRRCCASELVMLLLLQAARTPATHATPAALQARPGLLRGWKTELHGVAGAHCPRCCCRCCCMVPGVAGQAIPAQKHAGKGMTSVTVMCCGAQNSAGYSPCPGPTPTPKTSSHLSIIHIDFLALQPHFCTCLSCLPLCTACSSCCGLSIHDEGFAALLQRQAHPEGAG